MACGGADNGEWRRGRGGRRQARADGRGAVVRRHGERWTAAIRLRRDAQRSEANGGKHKRTEERRCREMQTAAGRGAGAGTPTRDELMREEEGKRKKKEVSKD